MTDNMLETEELTFYYEGNDRPSMDSVSIKIRKGVKTVILGANGAGKSTLFYHFNGIFRPADGRVLVDDQPLSYRRKALRQLRSRVSVVLQNPDDQIFEQTVEADVAFGPRNMKLPEDEVMRRVDSALDLVGLSDLRDRNTLQLSYGQRKRLALAGAIAMRPEILIMDEPTAGLDPQMALELMELMEQLHHTGTDVVLSTHDVDLAYSWAEDIHVLRAGRLVFSGRAEDFYSNPDEVYLAGLMQPSMFVINQSLCGMTGQPVEPYPRTETQLISKMTSGPKGRMYILPVDDRLDKYIMDDAIERSGTTCIGVFGTYSRKLLYQSGLYAEYVFNAFEACMTQCLMGNNSMLVCDRPLVDLIQSKVEDLRHFSPDVESTIL